MMLGYAFQQLFANSGMENKHIPNIDGHHTFFDRVCNYAIQQESILLNKRADSTYTIDIPRTGNTVNGMILKIELNDGCDEVGDYCDIFETVSLKLGGSIIESHTPLIMNALETIHNSCPIIRDGNTLYITLNMWCNDSKNVVQSQPMCCMQFHSQEFDVKFKEQFNKLVKSVELMVDYIFLDSFTTEGCLLSSGGFSYPFWQYTELSDELEEVVATQDNEYIIVDGQSARCAVYAIHYIDSQSKVFKFENGKIHDTGLASIDMTKNMRVIHAHKTKLKFARGMSGIDPTTTYPMVCSA